MFIVFTGEYFYLNARVFMTLRNDRSDSVNFLGIADEGLLFLFCLFVGGVIIFETANPTGIGKGRNKSPDYAVNYAGAMLPRTKDRILLIAYRGNRNHRAALPLRPECSARGTFFSAAVADTTHSCARPLNNQRCYAFDAWKITAGKYVSRGQRGTIS